MAFARIQWTGPVPALLRDADSAQLVRDEEARVGERGDIERDTRRAAAAASGQG